MPGAVKGDQSDELVPGESSCNGESVPGENFLLIENGVAGGRRIATPPWGPPRGPGSAGLNSRVAAGKAVSQTAASARLQWVS